MTTYRLMDGVAGRPGNGPASPTAFAGAFEAALSWYVTSGGMWLTGFYWWVPAGGDTGAQKFALWAMTGSGGAGTLVPGSVVTSGTLIANTWNLVTLPGALPLSIGSTYVAATGWTSVNGFPDTSNQFGTGQPFSAGITNGPLSCWSDIGGSNPPPYSYNQGLFSTLHSDPSIAMPFNQSNSSNFGIDIAVSDTPPLNYAGSYRLWPNNFDANPAVAADTNVNYDLATEIHLSQRCTLNNIWFYSQPGAVNLPTTAQVWNITSGLTVAANTSPSWSGIAGSGWVSCAFNTILPAGQYKASVYDASGTVAAWGPKSLYYWNAEGQGAQFYVSSGVNGITNGPLSAPNTVSGSLCWEYDGSAGGATPPFSNGIQEPGQSSFGQLPGGGDTYPQLYVDGLSQNYWVDMEVTIAPPVIAPVITQAQSPRSPVIVVSNAGWRNAGHSR